MANTALRVSELDFDTIKGNLIAYLRSQSEFADYDFEGAGLNVLLDILAYNTHYMGYYLNMVGNEMFMDTAQLRSSIVSHAKQINYIPGSMTGAKATINIKVTPSGAEDNAATTLTMPKYTRFISEPYQGKAYTFATTEALSSIKSNGSFTFSNVQVTQGEPLSFAYTVGTTKRFTIPSANVDTDTVIVSVQNSSIDLITYTFNQADDLTELSANSRVFFLEESSDTTGTYSIYFGDGTIGQNLNSSNIITIRYLETNGEYANKVNTFVSAANIGGYSGNIIVTSVSAASGGGEKETIENIRYRAPIAYTAQNRAVTVNDYQSLLLKDYPTIDAISVWSGDDNDPPVYGKIFISMKPKENYEITQLEKERIKTEIIETRSVLTVFPEIVDPDYTYLLVNTTVNYNPNITSLSEAELKQLIRQAVLDYRDSDLKKFDSTFRASKLQQAIDNAHPSLLGSSLKVFVQKRIPIDLTTAKNYLINFNLPIYKGVIDDKFYSYPSITVQDAEGISRQVFIEDTPNSLTGIDSIDVTNPGSGYENPPTVTITGDGTGATAIARVVNGKIASISVENRGTEYTAATVTITSDSGSGAQARVNLQARNGVLRSYYYKTTGEKVIVNSNLGTIDYVTGKVSLVLLDVDAVTVNDRYSEDYLTLNALAFNSLITPLRNRILDIDENDPTSINITMVPEV